MRLARPLRVALIGDSWVTDLYEKSDGNRVRKSHTAWAMEASLRQRLGQGVQVDFVFAGFPGTRSRALLSMCWLCRLRDMAKLAKMGYSWKYDPARALKEQRLQPLSEQPQEEELDVAVICVGSNDLYDQPSSEILRTLSELCKHLEFRGVEVCQCSLYLHETERQAWPEADQACQQVNETLKGSSCIDLDGFLQSLSPQHWRDEHHLADSGYKLLGQKLAGAVEERFCSPPTFIPRRCPYLLHVEEVGERSFVGNLVAGTYAKQWYEHHGKPIYWKKVVTEPEVCLFFWDDRNDREGVSWQGWWLGRLGHANTAVVEHPGWAFCPGDSTEPPKSGWIEVRSDSALRLRIEDTPQTWGETNSLTTTAFVDRLAVGGVDAFVLPSHRTKKPQTHQHSNFLNALGTKPESDLSRLGAMLRLVGLAWLSQAADMSSWDYTRQDSSWGQLCVGHFQSPIDIEPKHAEKGDFEIRMLYSPLRLQDVESAGVDPDGVPRIRFKAGRSVGKVQIGRGYGDFDEYSLSAIEVHAPSEHTLRKASWALEVQLWHDPMPVSRTDTLLQHTQQVLEALEDSDSRFAALERSQATLSKQLNGEATPWTANSAEGSRASQQAQDWVDAAKADIASVSTLLQQDMKGVTQHADRLQEEVKSLVTAQKRRFAGFRVEFDLCSNVLYRAAVWSS
ncbi:ptprf [Symbiodinium sp. KB8]|nr:ptprf [Symbiodinium sp. KB8]